MWDLMRRTGCSKDEIVDFSVDVNPLGYPTVVRSTVLDHLDDIRCYPDPDAQDFREAIAAYHRIPADTVLPGNGAAELIDLVTRIRPIQKALIVVPTFSEYQWAVEQRGATSVFVHTQEDWPQRLDNVEVAFLCNPNNPTGAMVSKAAVLEIAHRCLLSNTLLVIDEAFVDFVERPEEVTMVPEATQQEHVVVLRSLTKAFAIPGLRLGYMVGAPALIERVRALQQPWPLNTFALAVGIELLKAMDDLPRSMRMVAKLRDELQRSLSTIPGLHPFPSMTNFILCQLTTEAMTSSALCEQLAAQGILIRNCDSFIGLEPGRYIRIGVRTHADNGRLVQALHDVMHGAFSHAR